MALIEIAEKDRLTETEYAWRSTMTVGLVSGLGKNKTTEKKTYRCASIYFEAINLLLAYSLGLGNMAAKRAGAQPSMAAELTLNEAIEMYSRAASILSHVALSWATRWTGPSTKHRPPETTPAGLQILSEFMLIQGQILAAIKAEKRGMSTTTIVKLQRAALEHFQTVQGLLTASKGSEWSDTFQGYIREGSRLYEALMLKRFAAHCHSEDKNGMAVACMTRCYNIFMIDLKSIKTPVWAKIHAEYKDELKQLLDTYVRINNHVTYERIPSDGDMIAGLPTATMLVEKKAFAFPEAAEIPPLSEEELAAATASMSLKPGSPPLAEKTKSSSTTSLPEEEPEKEDEGPQKASVRNAFRSLLKVDKKEVNRE